MPVNRWEWLEGLKPESAIAAAVKHQAVLAADELLRWPPAVTPVDGDGPSRFAEIVAPGSPLPTRAAFDEAIKRARWDLTRNFDAITFYERNHHLANACPTQREQLACEFIQHYILESFFGLMEKTGYRIKRKDVIVGVDLFEQRINFVWGTN